MFSIQKIAAITGTSFLLFVPLLAANAQVVNPYGYNEYYPSTTYSDGYYPTSTYNNYYPSYTYQAPQAPTCTISITTPTTYSASAVEGTLSWTSTNASVAYLPNVGQTSPWGTTSVYAYPYQTFTLTVSGPGGTNTCSTEYYPPQQPVYYAAPTTYYPTYPTTTYVQPVYNYTYQSHSRSPINTIRNWWQNTFHW